MKREVVLHHHLGLGDHFVCNGLVHEAAKRHDKIHLPSKKRNFETVKCLYKDYSDIYVFQVENEYRDISEYCMKNKLPIIKIGFDYLLNSRAEPNVCFYEQAGLDYGLRYTSFKLPETIPNAQALYDKLVLSSVKYCLVHRQSSTGDFLINVNSALPIVEIESGMTNNLLDYVKIIQHAEEIHCIDSSVINLIDSIDTKTKKLYFHKIKPDIQGFKYSNRWNIITYL